MTDSDSERPQRLMPMRCLIAGLLAIMVLSAVIPDAVETIADSSAEGFVRVLWCLWIAAPVVSIACIWYGARGHLAAELIGWCLLALPFCVLT